VAAVAIDRSAVGLAYRLGEIGKLALVGLGA
jgi:hypothetical protein